ncbi:MAG: hypothetical protein WBD74_00510 [Candidatus Aquilonibacter sp.]
MMYLHSAMMHEMASNFDAIASFTPFAGAPRVATTSTTIGADLLVSGGSGGTDRIEKFRLTRADPQARVLTATPVHRV